MKIYIITSGCYSDYMIEQVFLNEEKAKSYCKFHTDCRIEEFENYDDNYIIPSKSFYMATSTLKIYRDGFGVYSTIAKGPATIQEVENLGENQLYVSDKTIDENECYLVEIVKYFDTSKFDSSQIQDRMRKISYDTCAEIANSIEENNNELDREALTNIKAQLIDAPTINNYEGWI